MITDVPNVVPCPAGGNSEHPIHRCDHCGKLPGRKRPKRRAQDCGPVQLKLSEKMILRRRIRDMILMSQLPMVEFAESVLGIDQVTLYRYLNGSVVPKSKAKQLQSIVLIERNDDHVHIVLRPCAERPRWDSMLRRRTQGRVMSLA